MPADLLERVGFDPADDGLVLGMIGRMDPQKGFDLLADGADDLLAGGARLVVQGSGHASLADPFRALAAARPRRVALIERFDRDMARRIYAGSDLFLMPSRFEPCGQGQMIALRYGTPPVVRRTGGLADSVVDVDEHPAEGTGFVFDDATPSALVEAIGRAAAHRRSGAAVGGAPRPRHGRRLQLGDGLGAPLPRGVPTGDRPASHIARPRGSARARGVRELVRHPDPATARGARRPRCPSSSSSR